MVHKRHAPDEKPDIFVHTAGMPIRWAVDVFPVDQFPQDPVPNVYTFPTTRPEQAPGGPNQQSDPGPFHGSQEPRTRESLVHTHENTEKLRWFHIPVNDMFQVESFFRRYHHLPNFSLSESSWIDLLRPELSGSIYPPIHATHMQPSYNFPGRSNDFQPDLALFLPYMNWERYADYCVYRDQLDSWIHYIRLSYTGADIAHGIESNYRRLHPRRTLDQFAFPSLEETSLRDEDQTVSKWTASREQFLSSSKADNESRLIMVDQLWCWVINDKTVLTCFPSHNHHYYDERFFDLYRCVFDMGTGFKNAKDFVKCVTNTATTYLFDTRNRKYLDLLGIYRWATTTKVAHHTTLFQAFQQSSAEGASSFNDQDDLALIRDLADIADELQMISSLLKKQIEILDSFSARDYSGISLPDLVNTIEEIGTEADKAREKHLGVLDLKQKSATLSEASSTAQQGRAVMLFTIVTVIFLPLSFFTSYFGQNVSEITGDDNNPSTWDLWKVGMPISLAVILLALCIAILITRKNSPTKIITSKVSDLRKKFRKWNAMRKVWREAGRRARKETKRLPRRLALTQANTTNTAPQQPQTENPMAGALNPSPSRTIPDRTSLAELYEMDSIELDNLYLETPHPYDETTDPLSRSSDHYHSSPLDDKSLAKLRKIAAKHGTLIGTTDEEYEIMGGPMSSGLYPSHPPTPDRASLAESERVSRTEPDRIPLPGSEAGSAEGEGRAGSSTSTSTSSKVRIVDIPRILPARYGSSALLDGSGHADGDAGHLV